MMKAHIGILAGLTFTLLGATSARAQQIQTNPGSACQASGSAQHLNYSGVTVATSPGFIDILDSGGGFTGNGCVFEARSSGTSLAGTGRSSTP